MNASRAIAAVILLIGFAAPAAAQQGRPPAPGPAPGFDGRYEIRTDVFFYDTDILRESHAREPYKTTILVDRQTGQTWLLMKIGESRVVWSAVEFRNSDGKSGARPQ